MQSFFGHFPASEFFNSHACLKQLAVEIRAFALERALSITFSSRVRLSA
jgi:hypothetical protein